MNKKADDRYITPWLVLNWFIILIALVIVVYMFYSLKIDVRGEEATLIGLKIVDCLIDSGEFTEEFLQEDFNIFQECQINKDIIWNGEYYFNVSVFQEGMSLKENITGTAKYAVECELGKDSEGEFPGCYEDVYYAERNNGRAEVRVFVASNQKGNEI